MTTIDRPFTGNGTSTSILDRERIIATAGFNRWLVPPAALCIHLCIGMAYGFSVFYRKVPKTRCTGTLQKNEKF
jgi:ABC-type xylose transport system permease subunit